MTFDGTILTLDLATNLGWCLGTPSDAMPRFGHHKLPSTGENIGAFAVAFEDWLTAFLEREKPAIVVFEAPILPRQTTPATVRKLSGLVWEVERVCRRLGIKCREGRKSSVNLFFAGHGWAKKTDTMAICRRYGWKVRNDDEADACALWAYAAFKLDPEAAKLFAIGPIGAGRAA